MIEWQQLTENKSLQFVTWWLWWCCFTSDDLCSVLSTHSLTQQNDGNVTQFAFFKAPFNPYLLSAPNSGCEGYEINCFRHTHCLLISNLRWRKAVKTNWNLIQKHDIDPQKSSAYFIWNYWVWWFIYHPFQTEVQKLNLFSKDWVRLMASLLRRKHLPSWPECCLGADNLKQFSALLLKFQFSSKGKQK